LIFSNNRAGLAADEVGDGRRLEIGIDLRGNALELAKRLDFLQPGIEVAAVDAARRPPGIGLLDPLLATRPWGRDAHLHERPPRCAMPKLSTRGSVAERRGYATESPA